MRQTINLSTRAPRISRFHFPAKVAKKVGPGGTQDWGGLRTHGDLGPGTRDRGWLVLNNTFTLRSIIGKKKTNSFSDEVL